MADVKIEKMCLKDLEKMDLNEFDDFWNENMLKDELLLPSSYYIIAKYEEDIVGFAGINLVLDEAHLANIVVKKNMRKRGVASKLLASIIDIAKENSSFLTLEVNENNLPGVKLYQKYGFEFRRKT